MSEILKFPSRNPKDKDDSMTPRELLAELLEAVDNGDTKIETLVVTWNDADHNGDVFQLRYMMGGQVDPSRVVGLLEMTKLDILG